MPAPQDQNRFYVYVLVDSRDGAIFYVGKGSKDRCRAHVRDWRTGREKNLQKAKRITEIVDAGGAVQIEILSEGMTEAVALTVERKVIRELGIRNLTNILAGEMSEDERAVLEAKDYISRIKPFEEWVSERHRSDREIGLYHRVAREFHRVIELAGHGYFSRTEWVAYLK